MRLKKTAATIGAGVALALSLSACGAYGEAHNYNAPAPGTNIVPDWTRIETPYHYSTIIHTCYGKDGLYDTLANDSSVEVIPNDPTCS